MSFLRVTWRQDGGPMAPLVATCSECGDRQAARMSMHKVIRTKGEAALQALIGKVLAQHGCFQRRRREALAGIVTIEAPGSA